MSEVLTWRVPRVACPLAPQVIFTASIIIGEFFVGVVHGIRAVLVVRSSMLLIHPQSSQPMS